MRSSNSRRRCRPEQAGWSSWMTSSRRPSNERERSSSSDVERRIRPCWSVSQPLWRRQMVRFNIIKVSPEKGITFRWEEALSFDGGSAPFIMYSHDLRAVGIHRRFLGGHARGPVLGMGRCIDGSLAREHARSASYVGTYQMSFGVGFGSTPTSLHRQAPARARARYNGF